MSPLALRENLKAVMKSNDKRHLDKTIRDCVAAGMTELEADIQEARSVSNILGGGSGG